MRRTLAQPFPPAAFIAWESLLHQETTALCAALLSLIEREPLFHLHDQPAAAAPLPGGYPTLSMYGEQGPVARGWLRRYRPEMAAGLHLLEGLVRSRLHLAILGEAAGGGALTHIGRLLAELLAAKQGGHSLTDDGDRATAGTEPG